MPYSEILESSEGARDFVIRIGGLKPSDQCVYCWGRGVLYEMTNETFSDAICCDPL